VEWRRKFGWEVIEDADRRELMWGYYAQREYSR